MRPLIPMRLLIASPAAAQETSAPPAGRITGIGGIFFKAKDPKSLAAWYRDILELPVED